MTHYEMQAYLGSPHGMSLDAILMQWDRAGFGVKLENADGSERGRFYAHVYPWMQTDPDFGIDVFGEGHGPTAYAAVLGASRECIERWRKYDWENRR